MVYLMAQTEVEHFSIVPRPVEEMIQMIPIAFIFTRTAVKRSQTGPDYQENYTLFYQSVNRTQARICNNMRWLTLAPIVLY